MIRIFAFPSLVRRRLSCRKMFLDVARALRDIALNHRIRAVVQVLENMCMRGSVECDSIILSDFAMLCAIPLRDGCDVLDVIGRRLSSMPA